MSTGWSPGAAGVVALPDGRLVRGRGLRTPLGADDQDPDFGLYLAAVPPTDMGWEVRWVRWRDFRLPHDPAAAVDALVEAFARAAEHRVEVACTGGTGRTGSALAVLARLAGMPADEAIRWTRQHYRPRAVETPWQRRWVRTVDLGRVG